MARGVAFIASATIALFPGCADSRHVVLSPPSDELSPEARVQWFMKLKPVDQRFVRVSTDGGDTWHLADTSLRLADGSEITLPEDLIPVVGTDTATASAARGSKHARHNADIAHGVATVAVLGGIALTWRGVDWFYAIPPSFAVGAIAYFIGRHYDHADIDERRSAFSHYTRDLGDRLNVCAHGTEVVPCDGPQPQAPSLPPATAVPTRTGLLRMRKETEAP